MSPWEQKAAQLDVEYMPWTPPNHGPADRAHFNYQGFTNDAMVIEAEASRLRDEVGIAAYETKSQPVEKIETAVQISERQAKLEKASEFLTNIDAVFPVAS